MTKHNIRELDLDLLDVAVAKECIAAGDVDIKVPTQATARRSSMPTATRGCTFDPPSTGPTPAPSSRGTGRASRPRCVSGSVSDGANRAILVADDSCSAGSCVHLLQRIGVTRSTFERGVILLTPARQSCLKGHVPARAWSSCWSPTTRS